MKSVFEDHKERIEANGWFEVTEADTADLLRQLGRAPRAVVAVAQRCHYGRPQVVVNDPLPEDRRGVRRVFPTLFWLTCPYLVQAVGALESAGLVARFKERLNASHQFAAAMASAHAAHARLRLEVCDPAHVEWARMRTPRQYRVVAESGVGGIRRRDGVKCLHAHLSDYLGRTPPGSCHEQGAGPRLERGEKADRRVGVNPVGRETARRLLEQGVDLLGSPGCTSCALGRAGMGGMETDVDGVPADQSLAGGGRAGRVTADREPEGVHRGRVAAIDVGSNSARLFIGEWVGPGGADAEPAQFEQVDAGPVSAPVNRGEGSELCHTERWVHLETVETALVTTRLGRSMGRAGLGRAGEKDQNDQKGQESQRAREVRGGRRQRLDERSVQETLKALADFRRRALDKKAPTIVAAATSAVREAENGGDLLLRAWEEEGLSIPTVSGRDEAELSFLGVIKGFSDAVRTPVLVVDVGGGSTELTLGSSAGGIHWSRSLPLGAVRMTERFLTSDPVDDNELTQLSAFVDDLLEAERISEYVESAAGPVVMTAVGGTATTIAAIELGLEEYDPSKVHGKEVSAIEVERLVKDLCEMPLTARTQIHGLQPERADIIIAGTVILQRVLVACRAAAFTVSEADILQGLAWRFAGLSR